MRKSFVLLVMLLLMIETFNLRGQNSTTSDKGVLVSGKVHLCDYERGCFISGNDIKYMTDELEISYDGYDKTYGIYVRVRGSIINLSVKYKNGSEEAYTYEGIDRVTERNVVVVTKQKLSTYLNNFGVKYPTEIKSSKGIIVTIPSTYTVFSIVPIMNQ